MVTYVKDLITKVTNIVPFLTCERHNFMPWKRKKANCKAAPIYRTQGQSNQRY